MSRQAVSAIVPLLFLSISGAVSAGPYLDQPPPGDEPVLFAPGIVSDGLNNRDMAITPDGREVYWSVNLRNFDLSVIMYSRQTGKGWSEPEVAHTYIHTYIHTYTQKHTDTQTNTHAHTQTQ